MSKQLKKIFFLFILVMITFSEQSFAKSQISFSAGGYSLSASGGTKPVSISNLGAYRLGFMQELRSGISLSLGYNILYESIITGDSIYGLDLGFSWFFLEPALIEVFKTDNVNLRITREWTPYVGAHFNQRQFQSNKSNYSGMGVHAGCQFPLANNYSWHAESRYNFLSGPSQATATEMTLFGGISSDF